MENAITFDSASQRMALDQLQSRIRSSIYDYRFSNQGSHCRTSFLQKRKADYVPNDMSIVNTAGSTVKTQNTGSIVLGEWSLDVSKGKMQVCNEMAPSPEQVSSITYCSDGDANSDSGFVEGGPFFHVSNVRLVSETPIQNHVQQSHLAKGKLDSIKHGSFSAVYSARIPSFSGGNSEVPFSKLQMSKKDSWGIPGAADVLRSAYTDIPENSPYGVLEVPASDIQMSKKDSCGITGALDVLPSGYMDIPKNSPDGVLGSKLKIDGLEQNDFFSRIDDSEGTYFPLDQSHGCDMYSILFGPTDASKFVELNEKTVQEDLLSYVKYKILHSDGGEVSFVKYMHSTVCNERTCNCDRFLLVSHFQNCPVWWKCNICEPVRRLIVNDKHSIDTNIQENSHLVSCDRELTHSDHIAPDDGQRSGKRLKSNSYFLFAMGDFLDIFPSPSQDSVREQQQRLHQWAETPDCNNLSKSNFGTRVSSIFQNLTGKEPTLNGGADPAEGSGLGILSNYSEEPSADSQNVDLSSKGFGAVGTEVTDRVQLSDSCCMSLSSGELLVDLKVEEEIGGGTVNVTDSFQASNSFHVSLPSSELIAGQQEYEGEGRIMSDHAKEDVKRCLASSEADPGMKVSGTTIMGVSLMDFLTAEEVTDHLSSLYPSGQDTEGLLAGSTGETICQLCFRDRLSFAPAPVYCSCCGSRIKPRLMYYHAIDEMGTKHSFCTRCFHASRGSDISFHGLCISKQKLHKEINNHVDDESWVQCDKCKEWQHQICALYNDKRDLGGKGEYVCPRCYLVGIEVGDCTPLSRSGAFEAKDLPTTLLSDYIEQRLFRRLKEERKERAKDLQMNYEEVPGASDLTVRVVLSVSKLLNVKQQFLDIIPDEKYPTEFPFKSKVILLFQKIDGVDVCLFGFYVQEFGSDCGHPNQRCIYISYLDSVKYFRPEIKTRSGEALRTVIYHEILIGYLEYCKIQGFATCYIWACPPMKREDYILYCHPVTQKTPKSDKLRHWYRSMLRKASKEKIAVDCTNLHDHYFVPTGEHNNKITLARLPYFDGDYWSAAAMDIINKIEHGTGVGSQINAKRVLTKRTLKSMGHSNILGDIVKDVLVMQKLGQSISPVKEDFIIVRLQFTCTGCHEVILSGSRWFCNRCKSVHLCSRCQSMEGNTHTSSSGDIHILSQATVKDVPAVTDDRDVILDNGYLEYRHSFLSFCQGNHFQFDELRRAKHSSMMILYHLHNSTVTNARATCRLCDKKMLVKQGWHCVTCPEFNVCDGCYRKQGGECHVHQLIQHSLQGNCGSRKEQAPPHEHLRLKGVMEGLLMHASQCNETKSNACSYPSCPQIRKLWRHAYQCKLQVARGCHLCQKTWTILKLHSGHCRDSGCRVPRCMDLKKHSEMLILQSDARRSASVLGSVRGV